MEKTDPDLQMHVSQEQTSPEFAGNSVRCNERHAYHCCPLPKFSAGEPSHLAASFESETRVYFGRISFFPIILSKETELGR